MFYKNYYFLVMNTDDLLNHISEKLRLLSNRYGHIDEVPLQALLSELGNELGMEVSAIITSIELPEHPAMAIARALQEVGKFAVVLKGKL